MEVLDILKKTLSFGIGTAVFGAEKFKEFADEMVQKGEMSSEDAKKFAEDVTKRADEERSKVQEWIKEQVSKAKSQSADVERVKALEARVAALEAKCGIAAPAEESCCVATGEEDPEG